MADRLINPLEVKIGTQVDVEKSKISVSVPLLDDSGNLLKVLNYSVSITSVQDQSTKDDLSQAVRDILNLNGLLG